LKRLVAGVFFAVVGCSTQVQRVVQEPKIHPVVDRFRVDCRWTGPSACYEAMRRFCPKAYSMEEVKHSRRVRTRTGEAHPAKLIAIEFRCVGPNETREIIFAP